jgi:hypothetical protein
MIVGVGDRLSVVSDESIRGSGQGPVSSDPDRLIDLSLID